MKHILAYGVGALLVANVCLSSVRMILEPEEVEQIMRARARGQMTQEEAVRTLEVVARGYRDLLEDALPPTDKDRLLYTHDSDCYYSTLRRLISFKDKSTLPFLDEMSLSPCESIRSTAIRGCVEVLGVVDALPFISRMERDSRYTALDMSDAYYKLLDLAVIITDYSLWKQGHERFGRRVPATSPYPELSDEDKKTLFTFLLEKIDTCGREGRIDNLLARQLPGYATSVQRAQAMEKFAQKEHDSYWPEVKQEIDKVPANQRKDFRAKGELLDPDRKDRVWPGTAAERLTDPAALAKLAKTDKDAEVRREAVAKLTDQALLAGIATSDKNPWVRREAVSRLDGKDQALLAKVAKDDSNPWVRRMAASKLTAQATLMELAEHDSDREVRRAAVLRIRDQPFLAKIATDAQNTTAMRWAAAYRLKDQTVLAGIARKEQLPHLRREAVAKLADQTLLAVIAGDAGEDRDVRQAAIRRLTDQAVLVEIVRNTKDGWFFRSAIGRLTDQKVLAEIAMKEENALGDYTAVRRLHDQALLAEVVKGGTDKGVRWAAVRKLTDKALLAEIAKDEKDEDLRKAATTRLERLEKGLVEQEAEDDWEEDGDDDGDDDEEDEP